MYVRWGKMIQLKHCENVIYVQYDLNQPSFGVNVLVEDLQHKLKL